MQFKDELLDAILDAIDAQGGLSVTTSIGFLRTALSTRARERKEEKLRGVTQLTKQSAAQRDFFCLAAKGHGGRWELCDEGWAIRGLTNVADVMEQAVAWSQLPAHANLAEQMPAAYTALSRRGYADFQTQTDKGAVVEVYAFKSQSDATAFRAEFFKDHKKGTNVGLGVQGLARKT